MNFLKRIFIYFIIVLFIWSVKYDLSNRNMNIDDNESQVTNDQKQENTVALEVIKYQYEQGDTMLSIVEKINGGSIPASTEQVIIDFRTANSNVDPYHLQPGVFYYFPKYKKAAP